MYEVHINNRRMFENRPDSKAAFNAAMAELIEEIGNEDIIISVETETFNNASVCIKSHITTLLGYSYVIDVTERGGTQ